MSVLTDLRNCGSEDTFFFIVCDGLKGLPEVAGNVWPRAIIQTAPIDLLRNAFGLPPASAGMRSIVMSGHLPSEQAALKCLYAVTRALDPTGVGRGPIDEAVGTCPECVRDHLRRPDSGSRNLLAKPPATPLASKSPGHVDVKSVVGCGGILNTPSCRRRGCEHQLQGCRVLVRHVRVEDRICERGATRLPELHSNLAPCLIKNLQVAVERA